MSSEPKKVVNLDRPRDGAAEEPRPGNPPGAPRDDVDRLLSDFLEHISSLAAEYESGEQSTTGPHQGPDADIPAAPMAENISNMAAAVEGKIAPSVPVGVDRPDPAPLSFIRDNAALDEEIERALSALEELPARREEPIETVLPDRTAGQTATSATAEAGSRVAEEEPAGAAEAPQASESLTDVPKSGEPAAPSPESAPAAREESRPMFTYSPRVAGRRKIVIGLAIAGAVALLVFVIYLLASRSRVGVPVGEAPQPLAAPAQPPATAIPESGAEQSQSRELVQPNNTAVAQAVPVVPPDPRGAKPRERDTGARSEGARTEQQTRSRAGEDESRRPEPRTPVMEQPSATPVGNTQQSVPSTAPQTIEAPSPAVSSPPPSTQLQQQPAPQPPRTVESASAPVAPSIPAAQDIRPQTPSSASQPGSGTTSAPRTAQPAPTVPPPPLRTVQSATQAELISKVLPNFPDFARRMNQTGRVELEIEIDAQGRVIRATPASGPLVFHLPAIEAVKKWRFKPATLNGERVASQGKVTVVFDKR